MRDLFRHLFLPHHTNNHKAKVLHLDSLLVYVLFIVTAQLALKFVHSEAPGVLGYATDIYVDQLMNSTNQKRQEAGLTPLLLNPVLSQAASLKAQHMISNNYWAHYSPDGKTPWDFLNSVGYRYTVAGENLAKNFSNSQGVVDAWMASPSHRDNLLKSTYRDVGFAVVNGTLNGEETTLVVQMFGATSGTVTERTVEVPPKAVAYVPQSPIPTVSQQTRTSVLQITTTPGPTPSDVPTPTPTIYRFAVSDFDSTGMVNAVFQPHNGVNTSPLFDIPTVTRVFGYAFIGMLLAVLTADVVLVARHRIVRVSGHSVAHGFFLAGLWVFLSLATRGSIL